VVEKDAVVFRDIEERHGLAVVIPGHGAELELNRAAFREKSDAYELVCGNFFL
jgi:hypothetical protein